MLAEGNNIGDFVSSIYFEYRVKGVHIIGCISFWTQQVRHGSLTRQSSHRSSYKVHRRHRSVSSSIPTIPSPVSLCISESYNRGRFTHLIFVTLATEYAQICTFLGHYNFVIGLRYVYVGT